MNRTVATATACWRLSRQYAREKLLDSGEAGEVRNHHLDFFMRLAESSEPHLRGPPAGNVAGQAGGRDRQPAGGPGMGAGRGCAKRRAPGDLDLLDVAYTRLSSGRRTVVGSAFYEVEYGSALPRCFASLAKARLWQSFLQLATGRASSRTTCIVEEARALAEQLGKSGKLVQVHVMPHAGMECLS